MANKNNKITIKKMGNIKITKFSLIYSSLILIFIVLLSTHVNANFVCGQVNDSIDNISASWYDVRIYYPGLADNYSSCQISPAENKFCCDAENISGKPWNIGQTIYSEVYDNLTGYVAGPVSLVTTSEGFDVFPGMNLAKVINIYNPSSRLIIANLSLLLFNSSFLYPYNHVEMDYKGNRSLICNNCSSSADSINFDFGMNYPKIIASYGNRSIGENLNFAIIKYFDNNITSICDKCKNNVVPFSSNMTLQLNLNLSHQIDYMELKEYVPINFDIINSDLGEVRPYSPTHNVIIWNVSGKNINKHVVINTPGWKIFSIKYLFKSELEGINLSENTITVRGILPFFSTSEKSNFITVKRKKYPKTGVNRPLILRLPQANLTRIAIFPNKNINKAEFNLLSYKYKGDLDNVIDYYLFDTNINSSDIDKIYIEYRLSKTFLKNNRYTNISLFALFNDNYKDIPINLYREDKLSNYYSAYLPQSEGFLITGLRN